MLGFTGGRRSRSFAAAGGQNRCTSFDPREGDCERQLHKALGWVYGPPRLVLILLHIRGHGASRLEDEVRSPGRNIRNHRYKTINAVRWQRGEKLDDLVDKSAALSQQSKLFYKQAKKTNSCCSVM